MRSNLFVAIAALAFATACGPAGQPKIFRVAIDISPIQTLNDSQCFKGNMPNLTQITQELNVRKEATWVVWDSVEGKQFLDMGTSSFTLADAPVIRIAGLIEGTQNVFSATRQEQDRGSIIELQNTNIITTMSDLGATPTGTIDLDAKYQCQNGSQNCPTEPNKRSCHAQIKFWGRRIESQQTSDYSPTGTGINVSTP